MTEIIKDEQVLINSIMANLPAIPLVVETVQKAINIAKKHLGSVKRKYDTQDSIYLHSLRVALEVSQYAKDNSTNMFFMYQPIVIALLHDIIEDADSKQLRKELDVFKSANNAVLESIKALSNNEKEIAKLGRSKYMVLKFFELAKMEKELLLIKLIDRLDNLKSLPLINDTEEYKADPEKGELFKERYLLETLNIYLNFNLGKVVIDNDIYKYYNQLVTLVVSDTKF